MLSSKRILSFSGLVVLLIVVLFNFSEATIHNVSIIDFAFVPQMDTVAQGDTVRWTNNGSASHTTTSDGAVWNSGTLSPGQSFSFQFNSTGTFPYHCAIHTSMHGTIVVHRNMPVFSNWALIVFVLLLLVSGIWLLRRRGFSVVTKTN